MRRRHTADWWGLRADIEAALRQHDGFAGDVQVDGRLRRIAAGLNHNNYAFQLAPNGRRPQPDNHVYILRTCRRNEGPKPYQESLARLKREAAVLEELPGHELPFTAPRFICFVGEPHQPTGLIETVVEGLPLEVFKKAAGTWTLVIDSIARVAAAVHRLPVKRFGFLETHAGTAAHLRSCLGELCLDPLADEPDAQRAIEWIEARAKVNRPAVVVHGDLLPQNILQEVVSERLAVIDWEYARIGDPAYDLAIVARGKKKVWGTGGGLRTLVEAYRAAGGAPIELADVMAHELLLLLKWLSDDLDRRRQGLSGGSPDGIAIAFEAFCSERTHSDGEKTAEEVNARGASGAEDAIGAGFSPAVLAGR